MGTKIKSKSFSFEEKDSQPFSIKRVLAKYLYHWPLFLLGLAICLGAAIIYLKLNRPVYTVKAALIINDEKKNPEQKSALEEIDLIRSNKTIENEIEVLKSNELIKEVVEDLELWISYQRQEKLFPVGPFTVREDLYKKSPLKFSLLAASGNYKDGELRLKVKDSKTFSVEGKDGSSKEYRYGQRIKTTLGTWTVVPTVELKKYQGETITIQVGEVSQIASYYRNVIDASQPNKLSTTIALTVTDEVAVRGEAVLNALINKYNGRTTEERNREIRNTISFLDGRIASLTGELTQVERGIEGFKSSQGLTDISSDAKVSLENMQANDQRLNEVDVQLNVIRGVEEYLNAPGGANRPVGTLGLTDATLTTLMAKLSELQLQRERMLATTPETNPAFEGLDRQIASTRASIRDNVKNMRLSLLRARNKLQSYNNRFESDIKDIPTQERQYLNIKRQQSIKENLYNYLLQKREELSVKYASDLTGDRVVDRAYVEGVKGVKKLHVLALALLLGLALPAGLIYARNSLSEKITDLYQIREALEDVPVIGQLEFEPGTDELILNKAGTSLLSEQFRALRINLNHYLGQKEGGRISLLTSSVSGEGKSFISKNLSLALAYSQNKTILVELDMRKPKIADLFKLDPKVPGMSEYLNQKAELNNVIRRATLLPNLDVITSGAIAENPSELLEKERLVYFLEDLRKRYDHIIIDSPPVHLVADSMLLSKLADLTLYVIRQGYTQVEELDFIKNLLEGRQLENVHLIFNGIERVKYGYGYAYNNNYYTKSTRKNPLALAFSNFSERF